MNDEKAERDALALIRNLNNTDIRIDALLDLEKVFPQNHK